MIKAHGNGIIFSTVFYRAEEHGLQLIRIQDGETVYIPLGEEHRVGRVYSVRISPFDESEWLYRYRSGNSWVYDQTGNACPYTGNACYDKFGQSCDPADDACGHTLSDCVRRFGTRKALPYGGFPGLARTRS